MSKFITLTVESADGDVIYTENITLNCNDIQGFAPIYGELQLSENGDGSVVWISRDLQLNICHTLADYYLRKPPRLWLEVHETPEQILALMEFKEN